MPFVNLQFARKFIKRLLRRKIVDNARCFPQCAEIISGAIGLEIGGPSKVFTGRNILPIYPYIKQLDQCNFSDETVWSQSNKAGIFSSKSNKVYIDKKIIAEATDLRCIHSETYDFLLASHVIEHIANPLLALSEWSRVLKEKGVLVLLVPHKDGTFDHRRPVSTIDHLIQDHENQITEEDLTHLPEIFQRHDLERDPDAGTFEAFRNRSMKNIENRCLHHHVFDTQLAVNMVNHMKLQILAVEAKRPCHIIILTRKLPERDLPDNHAFMGNKAECRIHSPFVSDHLIARI